MQLNYDAIVIGAGPAGATTAALLAEAGWAVAVVERGLFPRRKVCGEVISATNNPIFSMLGITAAVRSHAGPALREVALFSGRDEIIAPLPEIEGVKDGLGFTCAREHLDSLLLDCAQKRGVTAFSGWQAHSAEPNGRGRSTVSIRQSHSAGGEQPVPLTAPVIIAAHGSWQSSGLASQRYTRTRKAGDLFAFKAHLRGGELRPGLLPVLAFPGGYGGVVRIDAERITFACCVRRDTLQQCRLLWPGLPAAEAVWHYVLQHTQGLAGCLHNATLVGPWLAVGPIRPGLRQAYVGGVFTVGNALCETHPLIGEGITMALQSAWLLSEHLKASPSILYEPDQAPRIAAAFMRDWRTRFQKRAHIAAILAQIAMRPYIVNRLLPFLRSRPSLLSHAARLSGKVQAIEQPVIGVQAPVE